MDDREEVPTKASVPEKDEIDAKTGAAKKADGDGPDSAPAGQVSQLRIGEDQADSNPFKQHVRRRADFKHVYNMNNPKRGLAVVISNRNFDPSTGMSERSGTEIDAIALQSRFQELGFEVQVYKDLTVNQMFTLMKKAAAYDHSQSDCFACAILSHGDNGILYGKDGTIEIDRLTCHFKGDKCLTLAGKPKLFFIQACRGSSLDHGTTVTDAAGDQERIPAEADFLMAYSVVPGYFSWRNSARGSWFVQALNQVLQEHGTDLDMLTMMTRVNMKVAYEFESNAAKEYMNRKKQIPCIVSMLTKDLYFTPKKYQQ
ncbi:caspase-3-like [Lineus longissimus]|uniref:caspase-3-like n=1 Tax=Lineus longissimus TaxID=88925 RepID=UPI00315C731C